MKDLERYEVNASDGDIGSVANFLIDEKRWTVRYLVVQTRGVLFMDGRQVLISPLSFRKADRLTLRFDLALTMASVRNSPSIDRDQPVSRKLEESFSRYYGQPYYWREAAPWETKETNPSPGGRSTTPGPGAPDDFLEFRGDFHLRTGEEVRGYYLQGVDRAIGRIVDFIVDDETWDVRYLVVNARNWWFGRRVLVAPQWARLTSWIERKVYVNLYRQAVLDCPKWDPSAAIDRGYERRLHDYYGRLVYWTDSARATPKSPPRLENPPD